MSSFKLYKFLNLTDKKDVWKHGNSFIQTQTRVPHQMTSSIIDFLKSISNATISIKFKKLAK